MVTAEQDLKLGLREGVQAESSPLSPLASVPENSDPSEDTVDLLRQDILGHLESLQLPQDGADPALISKSSIRSSHGRQRLAVFSHEMEHLRNRLPSLLDRFAEGAEVSPICIKPRLVAVKSDTPDSDLFRLATLLWSVPVSRGYGRRMRYLVIDEQNDKLIGVLALGDPVFNLRARDSWIGWDAKQRRQRLVAVMDAFILGAVPPYSQLLGGKLVASLAGSQEVCSAFETKYGSSKGIISQQEKAAKLALVTTTSALGRSSLYNRLLLRRALPDGTKRTLVEFERIGMTSGYGHFQLSDQLFARLKEALRKEGHSYVKQNRFGQGPNWRIRVIRVGLDLLGLDQNLLRHGIAREIYGLRLASDALDYLRGETDVIDLAPPPVDEISQAALERWIVPRSIRMTDWSEWNRDALRERLLLAKADRGDQLMLNREEGSAPS